jgi:hypothetical protein
MLHRLAIINRYLLLSVTITGTNYTLNKIRTSILGNTLNNVMVTGSQSIIIPMTPGQIAPIARRGSHMATAPPAWRAPQK